MLTDGHMAKTSAFTAKPDVQRKRRQDTKTNILRYCFFLLVKSFQLQIKHAGLTHFK